MAWSAGRDVPIRNEKLTDVVSSRAEKEMEIRPIEVIDVLAFLLGIAALVVAIVGIRDVREQVKMLITMERNRAFTKVERLFALQFVDLNEGIELEVTQLKTEYYLLAHALDKNETVESTMHAVNSEILLYADMLVKEGHAKWKPEMDLESAEEVLRNWQTEKMVGTMFGNKPR